jgi:hypothetical protein
MKAACALAALALSTAVMSAEVTLVCTKTSGSGGSPSYVVVIDPDGPAMSVDGERLTDVELDGTSFIGMAKKRRRGDAYSVDRVSMKFGHSGSPWHVRDYDIRLEGHCEKASAKF